MAGNPKLASRSVAGPRARSSNRKAVFLMAARFPFPDVNPVESERGGA